MQRVLIIGMLDSIHLARWVKQFENTDVRILLFPSTHFKFVHAQLVELRNTKIRIMGYSILGHTFGYLDSIVCLRFLGNRISMGVRRLYLNMVIFLTQPTVIHAIEIQHAGYLVSRTRHKARRQILTNWGSDIYFYQHQAGHQIQIRRSLGWATHYSAECKRDYQLAHDYGFSGVELPCIPNAGGFIVDQESLVLPINRSLILVKCYGGLFGLGNLAITAIDNFLERRQGFRVFFYSVTNDLIDALENLKTKNPDKIDFATVKQGLSHQEMLTLFQEARVYLGCSISDGLSTSFLEALLCGAYPIQTSTSCAGELIEKGAVGTIIKPELEEIIGALDQITSSEKVLLDAQKRNTEFVEKFLNYNKISEQAHEFYL